MKHLSLLLLPPSALRTSLLAICLLLTPSLYASWSYTTELPEARRSHTTTLLNDGRVLVTGGFTDFNTSAGTGSPASAKSLIFDPTNDSWQLVGSLHNARHSHTATLLDDGRVFVTGGSSIYLARGDVTIAEIFDPTTNLFTELAPMPVAVSYHTATKLGDGKILIIGGFDSDGSCNYVQIYDPLENVWTTANPLLKERFFHTANLLPDGSIVIIGGGAVEVEIYDPATQSTSVVGNLAQNRSGHSAVADVDGSIVIAGGYYSNYGASKIELFSIDYGVSDTGLSIPGSANSKTYMTLLPNGKFLFLNRAGTGCYFIDRSEGNIETGPSVIQRREKIEALVLSDRTIMSIGGVDYNGSLTGYCEIYTYAPEIYSEPSSEGVLTGNSATLSVKAYGSKSMEYQWLKDGSPIDGEVSDTLTIFGFEAEDEGQYSVIVTNTEGSTTSQSAALSLVVDSDGDGISDADENLVYFTDPYSKDSDGDNVSDSEEITLYGTNPLIADTDSDGFNDAYEIQVGNSPTDATDKPELQAQTRIAVEFSFPSADGVNYRIEGSTDLIMWDAVENLSGTGSEVIRFYSTRETDAKFFRVQEINQ